CNSRGRNPDRSAGAAAFSTARAAAIRANGTVNGQAVGIDPRDTSARLITDVTRPGFAGTLYAAIRCTSQRGVGAATDVRACLLDDRHIARARIGLIHRIAARRAVDCSAAGDVQIAGELDAQ